MIHITVYVNCTFTFAYSTFVYFQPTIRIYDIPNDTFESDDEGDESSEEEDEDDEEEEDKKTDQEKSNKGKVVFFLN